MPTAARFCDWIKPVKDRERADVVLLGLPYEGTVNTRPGTVKGPSAIRKASRGIESYSPFLDKDLGAIKFFDDGDIKVEGKNKEALEAIAEQVQKRVPKSARAVFLGGDHSVTYGAVKGLAAQGRRFSIVHLDAHPDFQQAFEGEPWSYASAMRLCKKVLNGGEIYQLGIRTSTPEELAEASRVNKLFLMDRFVEGLRFVGETVKGKDIYVSFDIDAMDPSIAPGTSNPVSGGMLPDHLRALFSALAGANVIGFDLVEVAPNLDPSGFTPVLAAEIVRDGMLTWWA